MCIHIRREYKYLLLLHKKFNHYKNKNIFSMKKRYIVFSIYHCNGLNIVPHICVFYQKKKKYNNYYNKTKERKKIFASFYTKNISKD